MLSTVIKPNTYQDSVSLMLLSNQLTDLAGVNKVSVMMGTPANKDILRDTGFGSPDLDAARPGDMVLGIDADEDVDVAEIVKAAEQALANQASKSAGSSLRRTRSLERSLTLAPDTNLALVSIPGQYVAEEVDRMLDRGLNVMIFSDNVDLEDEIALKRKAVDKGLMVMGPDCGTAEFGGVPLAFSNAVAAGGIGIVGASGTGTQEVMCQVDQLGGGISNAIGLGGRDLSEQVGGLMCLQGLTALDDDPATSTIVVVSKPPAPEVRRKVEEVAQRLSKPVVLVFLGEKPEAARRGNLHFAYTLADAARLAVQLAGRGRPDFAPSQRSLRGLYTGGTLASEAAMLVRDELGLPEGDKSHAQGYMLKADGHEIIDLGDDAYTQGRPHPMIDPSARVERLPAVFDDPSTAVLLLDCVIGYGASDDPAGALVPAVREGLERAAADGRHIAVVVSVCGTRSDPQGYEDQRAALVEAGMTVLPDNATAVRHALSLLTRETAEPTSEGSTTPPAVARLLSEPPVVLNVGVRSFAETLVSAGASILQYDWAPAAGGDRHLVRLLHALENS